MTNHKIVKTGNNYRYRGFLIYKEGLGRFGSIWNAKFSGTKYSESTRKECIRKIDNYYLNLNAEV